MITDVELNNQETITKYSKQISITNDQ